MHTVLAKMCKLMYLPLYLLPCMQNIGSEGECANLQTDSPPINKKYLTHVETSQIKSDEKRSQVGPARET